MKPDAATDFAGARAASGADGYGSLGAFFAAQQEIRAMNKTLKPEQVVQTVKTDVDGKFEMTDVAPGSYYLYATYETEYSVAYWLVPITVEARTDLKVSLDNSNMTRSENSRY